MIDRPIAAALLALLLVAGCADGRDGYPSLAPRPAEREMMRSEAVSPAPPSEPAPPAPTADIAAIIGSARAADSAFRSALDKARPQIEAGRGASEGSEAWVLAQQAYSSAESALAPVSDALAELDRRRQAAVAAGDGAQEAAIADAAMQVQSLYDAERALLSQLLPA